jgi:hypothetical protein
MTTNSIPNAPRIKAQMLSFPCNGGGSRQFSDIADLKEFARKTSAYVATLTAVLSESEAEHAYIYQQLGLVHDLAFQLECALGLVFAEVPHD